MSALCCRRNASNYQVIANTGNNQSQTKYYFHVATPVGTVNDQGACIADRLASKYYELTWNKPTATGYVSQKNEEAFLFNSINDTIAGGNNGGVSLPGKEVPHNSACMMTNYREIM